MSAPVLRPSFGRTMFASLRLSLHMFLADPQWVIPSTIAPPRRPLRAFQITRPPITPRYDEGEPSVGSRVPNSRSCQMAQPLP